MVKQVEAWETEGGTVFTSEEEAVEEEHKERGRYFSSLIAEKAKQKGLTPTTEFYNAAQLIFNNPDIFSEALVDFEIVKIPATGDRKNGQKKKA